MYHRAEGAGGRRWFVKVYGDRDPAELERERAAIELAEFARAGGVPVPGVRRTRDGRVIADSGLLAVSLWEYVEGAVTAEGRLAGRRWQTVGAVVGRLHRRLAGEPAGGLPRRTGEGVCDLERARATFDRVIAGLRARAVMDTYSSWALEAAEVRRGLLGRLQELLARLPDLTVQTVHGDLASPNILLRGDEVAAVIDFWPPMVRHVAWEIARIGCDPRTVLAGDDWLVGMSELLAAYRDEHPAARREDLVSAGAVGCAWTLASAYTLVEPLDNPGRVSDSLLAYARDRHDAALVVLNRLDDLHDLLNDRLR